MRRPLSLASAALALGVLTACTPSHHSASTFGGYPSFLPKDTIDGSALHETVAASAAHPALATQGDTVDVQLPHGAVSVNLTGPEVPNEGLPVQSDTSPATWTLTFSKAVGTVPLAASAFNAIDEQGRVYRLHLVHGSALPATIQPGQTVVTKLSTTVLVGEGRLRWIPTGHLAPVEWDYTVETD